MAHNVSVLGRDFIDGCPVLFREERGLVRLLADSNKCDFTELEEKWRAFRLCVGDADVKLDAMSRLIESDVFADARLFMYGIFIRNSQIGAVIS